MMNENDRFDLARQDVRSKWLALPASTRKYIIAGIVIAVVVLLAIFGNYMTPGVYPRGEG